MHSPVWATDKVYHVWMPIQHFLALHLGPSKETQVFVFGKRRRRETYLLKHDINGPLKYKAR